MCAEEIYIQMRSRPEKKSGIVKYRSSHRHDPRLNV